MIHNSISPFPPLQWMQFGPFMALELILEWTRPNRLKLNTDKMGMLFLGGSMEKLGASFRSGIKVVTHGPGLSRDSHISAVY